MRRLLTLFLALVTALPTALTAQRAAAASRARELISAATRLAAAGDTASAADSALLATAVWPRQGAWRLAAARASAFAGRPDDAVTELRALTAMGFGWANGDSAWGSLRDDPAFQAVTAAAETNRQPLVASAVLRELPDERLHPEGIAFDPRTGRVFVSSIRQRKVVVVEPDGRVHDFVATNAGLDAVFGLAVDTARGRLWLASGATPEQAGNPRGTPGSSEVVAVMLDDGRLVGRWSVPDTSGSHLIGDVVLGPDGVIHATDALAGRLYRLPATLRDGPLEPAPWHHPDWRSPQGLAIAPDGRSAWLADWTTGLYRIDLVSGSVNPVGGRPEDYMLGVDGLYPVAERRLVGLQNGISPARVVAFDLNAAGDSVIAVTVLDRHLPLATEPTLGVVVAGALVYVANSPWAHYRGDGSPDPARPFPKPILLRLPLP